MTRVAVLYAPTSQSDEQYVDSATTQPHTKANRKAPKCLVIYLTVSDKNREEIGIREVIGHP
jgi:hypothetical protein